METISTSSAFLCITSVSNFCSYTRREGGKALPKQSDKNVWSFLPEYVVNSPSVDYFKNRLDKQWSTEKYYKTTKQGSAPAGHKMFAPAGTQHLIIEAKAYGHEDTKDLSMNGSTLDRGSNSEHDYDTRSQCLMMSFKTMFAEYMPDI